MIRRLHALLCIAYCMLLSVSVRAQLDASFTSSITSGCSPIVVQFTSTSTGSPTGYLWKLGNNTTSTLQNPSTTYVAGGTYDVTLIVYNGTQTDTQKIVNYITVYPQPTVSFYASDSSASCPPKTVQFTNTSVNHTPGAATYLWDFGDGTSSTSQNPSHTYTDGGNYNVTLVVTNSAGCSKSLVKTNYMQILAAPIADFTSANASSCTVPATVNFTNTTTGATSYAWDFGNGATSTSTNPTKTYSTSGTYTVTLIATNALGCKDTVVKSSFVNIGNLNAAFTKSASTICKDAPVTFTNTSMPGPGTSTWYFGDGTSAVSANASHTYTTAGTYTVKLVVNYVNCADSVTQTVTVSPGPTANFSGTPVYGCTTPLNVQFTNSSTGGPGLTYAWTFGPAGATSTATNPSYTYNNNGNYTVRLIATSSNGCSDTMTKANYIKIGPPTGTITATPPSGCVPLPVQFSSSGINSPIPISSYSWNFGDGSATSSLANPSHTFSTTGTFTVILTFTTGPGCTFTKTTTVNVGTPPIANFTVTPTTVCPNTNVTYTSTSSGASSTTFYIYPPGTPFNGYYILNGPVATWPFDSPGTYSVTLIATNGGCTDTMTVPSMITVELPLASFTPAYSCTNRKRVSFTNNSVGGTSYTWDFGDGTATSTQTNPNHTYASFGTYTVTLSTFNATTGCTDVDIQTVHLFPLDAQFSADDTTVCKGQAVTFTAAPDPNIVSYTWSFGTGPSQTNTVNTASFTYTTPGTYTVRLIVKDTRNCLDTLVRTGYMVVSGPQVDFAGTPVSGCAPLTVNFTDLTTNSGGNISSRAWTWGDGTTLGGNNASPSHTYTTGTYTVKLVVTSSQGCKDSITKTNYITTNAPDANFTANDTTVCPGQAITFTNASTPSGLTYAWNFGDGTTSTAANPNKTYSNSGNYTVRLIATNAAGCKDTLIRTSYIDVGGLDAVFSASDTFASCPPLTVHFTNLSTGASSYSWSFGNGNTSALASPNTTFTQAGVYTVKLIVTNGNCVDTATKTITVLGPSGSFTYSPLSGCMPLTVNFTATANNTQAYIWDMNNGVTVTTTTPTLAYTYTQSGSFLPILLLSDGISCTVPVVGTDTIKPEKIVGNFTISGANQCGSGTVSFNDTLLQSAVGLQSISWDFGDGGTSTSNDPSHFYSSAGTYTVTMIMTSSAGCIDTVTKNLTIKNKPVVNAGTDTSLCTGQTSSIVLSASGLSSSGTYLWSPGATLSCTACKTPTASPTVSTVYTVIGTASNGCSDTDEVAVNFAPLPVVNAGANVTICSGAFTQLQASGASTYSWTPSDSLSCNNCQNPSADPINTTSYIVTGIDTNGCSNKDTVQVTVSPLPTVSGGPNQIICAGASATLQGSGATSYSWSPSAGLSCTSCASPVASPSVTATYTVTGIGGAANTCANTAQVTVTVNPLPVISAGPNQTICIGTTAQLNATGAGAGGTYSWTPATALSATNIANPVASPAATTVYTVTGTNAALCSNTGTVTVNVNLQPVVSAGNNVAICQGANTTLQATGATIYNWSPATGLSATNIANPVASPAATTTYTVVGTNANGCTDTAQVIVTINTLPAVTASGGQAVCPGGTAQLQATGASTYVWTPATGLSATNISNPVAAPAATTSYVVTGTDANGCHDTGNVTVTVYAQPNINAGPNQAICTGGSFALQAAGGANYTWLPNATLSCTACANPTATPIATTTYTVTGFSANGCPDTGAITITVNPLPVVNAGADDTVCLGSATVLQPSGASSYVWSPSAGLSCVACANPSASPAAATTYTVTGTDVNGCISTDQLTIGVNPLPVVSAGPDQIICQATGAQLSGSGALSYTWSPAAGLSCVSCAAPIANPTGPATYTVTGTDGNGCSNTDAVFVNIFPAASVSAGADKTICNGDSVMLTAIGAVSYSWSPAADLSCTTCFNPYASPASDITYTVIGIDANGCVDTAQISIDVILKNVVSFSDGDSLCKGESVELSASGGDTYQWIPADGLSNTTTAATTASPSVTTQYMVIVSQSQCFADTGTITVIVSPQPTVEAGPDVTMLAGETVTLNPVITDATIYAWSPTESLSCSNCANPAANPKVTTTYTIYVANEAGCHASDSLTIAVKCDNSQIFMPNTFTPNGDLHNDKFFVQGKGISRVKRFRIYTRWGEAVYDVQNVPANDPVYGWDGTFKGEQLKPDVYVYMVSAECDNGTPSEYKGDISLIR